MTDTERQNDLAKLRGLRPMDDDFMRCMFHNNAPLAQFVLRILTGKPDLVLDSLETQKDLKRLVGARSIILDVFGTDSAGRKYDLEIQRSDHGADQHRARYHASAMDIANLHAGQEFEELPETFVIFITENDIFRKGKSCYRIERVNLDSDEESFADGEHILYINGAYRGETDVGLLMHDFCCWDPDEMHFALMRDTARYYKETQEGVEIMCKAFEETRKEGELKRAMEDAKRMIARGKLTLEEIAEDTNLPLEKVQELAGQKTA